MVHLLMGYVAWHRSAKLPGMIDPTENPTPAKPVATHPTDATEEAIPVATAAAALGITSDAIRARIRRGALHGEKRGGAWFVFLPEHERHDTKPDRDTTARHDTNTTGPDATQDVVTPNPTDATPIVDLAPLADLIERQAKELADLREAAAIWQIRARQAEEQLKQLTAGTTDSDTEPELNTVDAEGPQLLQERDPAPTGVLAWWKRLWGS